jgi:hypothetical protein
MCCNVRRQRPASSIKFGDIKPGREVFVRFNFSKELAVLRDAYAESPPVIKAEIEARRKCLGHRKDGNPCKAWAVWDDPGQRCAVHSCATRRKQSEMTEGIRAEQNKRHAPVCKCSAYKFPHRLGNGLCRFPDEPLAQHPAKGRSRSPERARSFRRAVAYIHAYGGEFPSVTQILGKSKRKVE